MLWLGVSWRISREFRTVAHDHTYIVSPCKAEDEETADDCPEDAGAKCNQKDLRNGVTVLVLMLLSVRHFYSLQGRNRLPYKKYHSS